MVLGLALIAPSKRCRPGAVSAAAGSCVGPRAKTPLAPGRFAAFARPALRPCPEPNLQRSEPVRAAAPPGGKTGGNRWLQFKLPSPTVGQPRALACPDESHCLILTCIAPFSGGTSGSGAGRLGCGCRPGQPFRADAAPSHWAHLSGVNVGAPSPSALLRRPACSVGRARLPRAAAAGSPTVSWAPLSTFFHLMVEVLQKPRSGQPGDRPCWQPPRVASPASWPCTGLASGSRLDENAACASPYWELGAGGPPVLCPQRDAALRLWGCTHRRPSSPTAPPG